MRYLSVCSGIEAATAAWHHLGWTPVGFSEIEPFPSAVLAHRYPGVRNYGDLTQYESWGLGPGDVDLVVGGTPCQAFSVAGLREGLADARGNLALVFCQLVDHLRPRWVLWENVPGVLSSGRGRDFGSIVGALADCGYGFAYRVLDAQHFGVPQRRRRVFLIGHLGDWEPAASVLLEPESVRGDSQPRHAAGEDASLAIGGGAHGTVAGTYGLDEEQNAMREKIGTLKARTAGGGFEGIVATVNHITQDRIAGPLDASYHKGPGSRAGGEREYVGIVTPTASAIRRLTPRETERLQGFPDDYTLVPWRGKAATDCPDAPRYKAIGNSMAVPVMRWIGERIAQVEKNLTAQ